MIRSKAAALVVIASFSMSKGSVAQEEVIIAHSVRAAFYEIAPKPMAASMRQAVTTICAEKGTGEGWLCDGRSLIFLRGVLVTGDKLLTGYVCLGSEADRIKFYLGDMLETGCAPLAFDGDSQQYSIDLSDVKPEEEL